MRNQNYGGTLAGLGPQRSPTAENNEPSSPIMALMTGLHDYITTKGRPALKEKRAQSHAYHNHHHQQQAAHAHHHHHAHAHHHHAQAAPP